MTWRPPPTPPADTEATVIAALTVLLPAHVRVAPDLVGWTPRELWVSIARVGSQVSLAGRMERVALAVQVIAPSKAQAWDLASAVQVSMLSMPDLYPGITKVDVEGGWGHTPLPDTVEGVSRYTATFTLNAAGLVA